jgi:stage II sporulation protein M
LIRRDAEAPSMTDDPADADWSSDLAEDGADDDPAWSVADATSSPDAVRAAEDADADAAAAADPDETPGLRERLAGRFARANYRRWLGGYLLVAVVLFFVAAAAGWELLSAFSVEQLQALGEEFGPAGGTDFLPKLTTMTIFLNNARVAFIAALGAVTGGITSVFVLLLNGFIVGAVVNAGAKATSLPMVLALIVPHGVLELPAFWVVSAVSFRVTHRFGRYAWGADERPLTRQEVFEAVVIFVAMVAVLLVAAAIEVHVTPAIGETFGAESAIEG